MAYYGQTNKYGQTDKYGLDYDKYGMHYVQTKVYERKQKEYQLEYQKRQEEYLKKLANNTKNFYTTALGFLPVDTRYLSNTTNSLAYNSLADVALNYAAWDKRYGKDSWLTTWYGYIPRLIWDTGLLIKDTAVDPVVQGAIDDGWDGFTRGLSTAGLNILINLGNTLDVVSNPIKGAFIEGLSEGGSGFGSGFMKGLIGDEHGRKQYDYSDYIDLGDEGTGFGDLALSFGLEFISDPANWFTLGTKGLIKLGSNKAANTALDSVRATLNTALDSGLKNVDELIDPLMGGAKYLTKDTAVNLLNQMADADKVVTKSAVNSVMDNLESGLSKSFYRIGHRLNDPEFIKKLSDGMSQSKYSRYKAGLFNKKVLLTSPEQKFISEYLQRSITDLPDLLGTNLNSTLKVGTNIRKAAETSEKWIRRAALYPSPFIGAVGLGKGAKYGLGVLNNKLATKRKDLIMRTVADLDKTLQFTDITPDVSEAVGISAEELTKHSEVFKALSDVKDLFTENLYTKGDALKATDVVGFQRDTIKRIESVLATLDNPTIKTLDDYINYFKKFDMPEQIDQLQTLKKFVTENVNNKEVLSRYKAGARAYIELIDKKFTDGQADSITNARTVLKQWRELQTEGAKATQILNDNAVATDEALEFILNENNLSPLEDTIIPYTRQALSNNAKDVERFDSYVNAFKRALNEYEGDTADTYLRERLVLTYQELVEHLKGRAQFPEYNISSASDVINELGAHPAGTDYLIYLNNPVAPTLDDIKKVRHVPTAFEEQILKYVEEVIESNEDFIKFERSLASDLKSINTPGYREWYDRQINDYLQTHFTVEQVELYEQALKIRESTYVKDVVFNKIRDAYLSAKDLTNLINDLPKFDVKLSSALIDPTDYTKYKLITYSIMLNKTNLINEMLGIDSLGNFLTKSVDKSPMAALISEYTDGTSDLYTALNKVEDYSEYEYVQYVKPVKDLLERMVGYKSLVQDLHTLVNRTNLSEAYQQAYLDQLVTQLNRGRLFTDYTLDAIVEDLMSGADLFLNQRIDAGSVSMDYLLAAVSKAVLQNDSADVYVKQIAEQIQKSLSSGYAHEAMTDVDNWIALMNIADYSDNTLVKSVKENLLAKANGRHIVVFDMETTGAKEATATPFQISGKVLDPEGNIVPGSEFNYIIKPPADVKPLPTVLEKLAAGSSETPDEWWKNHIVNAVDNPMTNTTVFTDVQTAIKKFYATCSTYGEDNFILAGQNIRKFDTAMLSKYADDSLKNNFKHLSEDLFDSIEYFNLRNVYQLQGEQRKLFKYDLKTLLSKAISNNNLALKQALFNYSDINTLRTFKEFWSEKNKDSILTTSIIKSSFETSEASRAIVSVNNALEELYSINPSYPDNVSEILIRVDDLFPNLTEQIDLFKAYYPDLYTELESIKNSYNTFLDTPMDSYSIKQFFKDATELRNNITTVLKKMETYNKEVFGTNAYYDDIMQGYKAVEFLDADAGFSSKANDFFGVDYVIDKVVSLWRSPSKFKGQHYFTVSKLNPNSFEESVQSYLKELANKGLIDVAPGQTIMQYFNKNVAAGNIVINPRRAMSYEVEDIFDLNKALESFKVLDKPNNLKVTDMENMTRQMISIKNIRTWITQDLVDYLKEPSAEFLKELKNKKGYAKILRDNLDSVSTVAAAMYYYKRLDDMDPLLSVEKFKHIGDTAEAYKKIRGYEEYDPTPLLHFNDIDPATGQLRGLYESDYYNLSECADALEDNPLNAFDKYNIEHNLHNATEAAKHKLYSDNKLLAQEIEDYLNKVENRSEVERSVRKYYNHLDTQHVYTILNRSDRVKMLKEEAKVRASRVIFTTKAEVDLSDFKADSGLLVKDNIILANGSYMHIILMKQDVYDAAADSVVLHPQVLTGVEGIDDTMQDFLKRNTARNAACVKNVGLSHGDVLLKEKIEALDNALLANGWFDEVDLAQIPDANVLDSLDWFNQLNANNTVIGDININKAIFGDDVVYISDPFKQTFYNLRSAVNTHQTRLTAYLNLALNKYSSIDSDLFNKLKPEDLFKLLKNNDDFGLYYVQKSSVKNMFYSDITDSGVILKELKVVNAKSIEVARELGVYVLPRIQAGQMMQAINTFKLPRIAQYAKDISDTFKLAYLCSVGWLIRNIVDSNYKTRVGLDGEVMLPTQLTHLFSSMKLTHKYTEIGKTYSAIMHTYFKTDLDYKVFYTVCKNIGSDEDTIVKLLTADLSDRNVRKVTNQVHHLLEKADVKELTKLQNKLIEPELFSIIDAFNQYGPSTGLNKSILNNIMNPAKTSKDSTYINRFNKLLAEHTPARFILDGNEFIEQSARLSMFLQDLNRGSNINDAIKNVVKTHFDYSDKSLSMIYAEIIFPFLSFSYKNLEFWVDSIAKNPLLLGELENIFRTTLNYNSIFNPDQEAYEAYNYTFDWSKNVFSFESNAPWTMINAARLYHILNGNIVLDTGKDVEHNAGYGTETNDLYTVFKLSPSVLDAAKMLYSPLSVYSERLLPPFETLVNIFNNIESGESISEQMNLATLANILPYADVISQRVGLDQNALKNNEIKLKHNNIIQRVKNAGLLMAMPSVFGAAYVTQKDKTYFYDSDYNILGGFKNNYYAKRKYYNPYYIRSSNYSNQGYTRRPEYTITRMAQDKKKAKDIYVPSQTNRLQKQQLNSSVYDTVDRLLRVRIKDYSYYY